MSTKTINISGHANNNEQFVVRTNNQEIKIGANAKNSTLNAPSPIEYILAGYAGCINAIGSLVAQELKLNLQSLQVDVQGVINVDKFLGNSTTDRAGFSAIAATIIPEIDATASELKNWLQIIEERCPVGDNLKFETPIQLNLVSKVENETVY